MKRTALGVLFLVNSAALVEPTEVQKATMREGGGGKALNKHFLVLGAVSLSQVTSGQHSAVSTMGDREFGLSAAA